ncbi:Guanine nucleotide exchange protein smcr8 [Dispira parvispora]|uniref:Guanine nucleotide exchange protein smcr8 n=1 Tax=Dispira parvispora TaxID=1520584 RepID=A0A9W8E9C3_9FUNG|nr:Guanine nucleotide exchange protein smcr8 [Dispira parvispora]
MPSDQPQKPDLSLGLKSTKPPSPVVTQESVSSVMVSPFTLPAPATDSPQDYFGPFTIHTVEPIHPSAQELKSASGEKLDPVASVVAAPQDCAFPDQPQYLWPHRYQLSTPSSLTTEPASSTSVSAPPRGYRDGILLAEFEEQTGPTPLATWITTITGGTAHVLHGDPWRSTSSSVLPKDDFARRCAQCLENVSTSKPNDRSVSHGISLTDLQHSIFTRANAHELSLRTLSADYLGSEIPGNDQASFQVPLDNQLLIYDAAAGAYGFVHHFTLIDTKARGFVRPFFVAYLSESFPKMMLIFEQLMHKLTLIVKNLKLANYQAVLEHTRALVSDHDNYLGVSHEYNQFSTSFTGRLGPSPDELKDLERAVARAQNLLVDEVGDATVMDSLIAPEGYGCAHALEALAASPIFASVGEVCDCASYPQALASMLYACSAILEEYQHSYPNLYPLYRPLTESYRPSSALPTSACSRQQSGPTTPAVLEGDARAADFLHHMSHPGAWVVDETYRPGLSLASTPDSRRRSFATPILPQLLQVPSLSAPPTNSLVSLLRNLTASSRRSLLFALLSGWPVSVCGRDASVVRYTCQSFALLLPSSQPIQLIPIFALDNDSVSAQVATLSLSGLVALTEAPRLDDFTTCVLDLDHVELQRGPPYLSCQRIENLCQVLEQVHDDTDLRAVFNTLISGYSLQAETVRQLVTSTSTVPNAPDNTPVTATAPGTPPEPQNTGRVVKSDISLADHTTHTENSFPQSTVPKSATEETEFLNDAKESTSGQALGVTVDSLTPRRHSAFAEGAGKPRAVDSLLQKLKLEGQPRFLASPPDDPHPPTELIHILKDLGLPEGDQVIVTHLLQLMPGSSAEQGQ